MLLLLLKLLVDFFLIRDYVGYSTTCVSEEQYTHDHQYATCDALNSIGPTNISIPNCGHCSNCKVKRSDVELRIGKFLIITRVNPIIIGHLLTFFWDFSSEYPKAGWKMRKHDENDEWKHTTLHTFTDIDYFAYFLKKFTFPLDDFDKTEQSCNSNKFIQLSNSWHSYKRVSIGFGVGMIGMLSAVHHCFHDDINGENCNNIYEEPACNIPFGYSPSIVLDLIIVVFKSIPKIYEYFKQKDTIKSHTKCSVILIVSLKCRKGKTNGSSKAGYQQY